MNKASPPRKNPKGQRGEVIEALSLVTQIGTTMTVTIFVGFGIGYFFDKYSGTSPVMTVIFLVLGAAAAIRNLFMMTEKFRK